MSFSGIDFVLARLRRAQPCFLRSSSASYTPSIRSLMRFCTPIGVMPIFSFHAICLSRRRVGLADRRLHRIGHHVGVQDRHAVDVPRGAADRLDQRALGAQEAFLVGVEDRHQRHLGNVEALAQQVDADQHVELAEPQVADDLDALDGVDVGVQVAHLDAVLVRGSRSGPRPSAWSAWSPARARCARRAA